MDQADSANDIAQMRNDAAVKAALQQRVLLPQLRDDNGNIICRDCGEIIMAARLLAMPGAVRCVECEGWQSYRGGRRG